MSLAACRRGGSLWWPWMIAWEIIADSEAVIERPVIVNAEVDEVIGLNACTIDGDDLVGPGIEEEELADLGEQRFNPDGFFDETGIIDREPRSLA